MQSQQLDIFSHSRDVELCNDVVSALERREPSSARAGWQAFSEEYPAHPSLASLATLVAALNTHQEAPFVAHEVVRKAYSDVEEFGAAGIAASISSRVG
jgi:hypothetical protein